MSQIKECCKCTLFKTVDNFGRKASSADGLQSQCSSCRSAYFKEYNQRPERKKQLKKTNKCWQTKAKTFLKKSKEGPCSDCGVEYPAHIMEWDHVRGTKRAGVSQLVGAGIRIMKLEIEKCDLVCANCHRERTHQRRINPGSSNT